LGSRTENEEVNQVFPVPQADARAQDVTSIAIVICTFNRQDLLKSALKSIAKLRDPGGVSVRVVVVDNSDDSNAFPAAESMRADMPWDLELVAAHPPNISVARNAGVAAAAGAEIVAFVDDDQQLAPDWLVAVAKATRELPHDVFIGTVEAYFERPDLAGPMAKALFARRLDEPTGYDLYAMGRKKTRGVALATNNAIFRRSPTLTDIVCFDPAFGNGGGEDYDLFCRLERRGRRFAWLGEARASEHVPASRCDTDYLERRLFAGGQAFAMAVAKNSPVPLLERWRQRLIALAQLALLAPKWLTRAKRSVTERAELRIRVAAISGKLSFRQLVPIYRREHKA
jgi:succinoglycan biosynthesis protein ExoM